MFGISRSNSYNNLTAAIFNLKVEDNNIIGAWEEELNL
jgi:hypothetical protein